MSVLRRLAAALREELGLWRPWRSGCLALTRVLPPLVGNRCRAYLVRLAGISVGRGTTFGGRVQVVGTEQVIIGRDCWINSGLVIDATAKVTIGDGVSIAQDVMIVTHTHEIGADDRRAANLLARPVAVGSGSWIGARALLLPGVSIGSGAVIAAGAVVASDVRPDVVAGGVPAQPIRDL